MKKHPTLSIIGLLVLLAILISFPFFKIKYFEVESAFVLIYHIFLLPFIVIATVGIVFLYSKYLRKFNKKTNSKFKIILQDFFMVTTLSLIVFAILNGLTLSTIVTTNAYLGVEKKVTINETVIDYEAYTTKNGRLRHYIKFKNPITNIPIRLEVYTEYEVGDTFVKEMRVGKWGQLYSFE